MTRKIQSIFLVDDDPDDKMLFEEALSQADRSILYESANDGIEALQKLNSQNPVPDLLFMDVNMPRMNGINCLKELQKSERLRGIPVIMYSTSRYYQKECFENGAGDYIEKHNDYKELCAAISLIVRNGLPIVKTISTDKL